MASARALGIAVTALVGGLVVAPAAVPVASAAPTDVKINEVESNGGVPGDWVELINTGTAPVDVSGWYFRDNDDTRMFTIAAGTVIAPGGYLVLDEAQFGFGLGAADSARLYDTTGITIIDSTSWTAHAVTTYGRCPNGTGGFVTSTTVTKGAVNDCSTPPSTVPPTTAPGTNTAVRVNEVESNGGVPGDWVELVNPSSTPADVSGWYFRDNDDTRMFTIAAGTVIAPGGYLVLDEAQFGFGLGAADSARLYDTTGITIIDSTSWTAHAVTTYGRCPDATGAFQTTGDSTKGAANNCGSPTTTTTTTTTIPGPAFAPWPGSQDVTVADLAGAFPSNLSGLVHQASGTATPGTLWAVRNGPGGLFRLVWNGSAWIPDTADGWGAGKLVRYPDGLGDPDAEGVTIGGASPADGIYVATERNNAASSVSRNSVLRFDPSGSATTLTATHEWQLADLPATGANLGLEAITFVPDTFLVAHGLFDESLGRTYSPADHPGHGTGLFFVSLESGGSVYAYALNHVTGTATRVATFTTGLPAVMDLHLDADLGDLWAVCDNTCAGRTSVLRIDAATGRFAATNRFERPTGMPNTNNEGFTMGAGAECVNGRKPAYWADDSALGGNAIRRGDVPCTVVPPAEIPEFPLGSAPIVLTAVVLGGWLLVRRRPTGAAA
jgi:hypothetical protein